MCTCNCLQWLLKSSVSHVQQDDSTAGVCSFTWYTCPKPQYDWNRRGARKLRDPQRLYCMYTNYLYTYTWIFTVVQTLFWIIITLPTQFSDTNKLSLISVHKLHGLRKWQCCGETVRPELVCKNSRCICLLSGSDPGLL